MTTPAKPPAPAHGITTERLEEIEKWRNEASRYNEGDYVSMFIGFVGQGPRIALPLAFVDDILGDCRELRGRLLDETRRADEAKAESERWKQNLVKEGERSWDRGEEIRGLKIRVKELESRLVPGLFEDTRAALGQAEDKISGLQMYLTTERRWREEALAKIRDLEGALAGAREQVRQRELWLTERDCVVLDKAKEAERFRNQRDDENERRAAAEARVKELEAKVRVYEVTQEGHVNRINKLEKRNETLEASDSRHCQCTDIREYNVRNTKALKRIGEALGMTMPGEGSGIDAAILDAVVSKVFRVAKVEARLAKAKEALDG